MDLFSEMGDDGVDDILSPRPRSLEDKKKTTSNYLGLNLGRSQSAAPETWEYGNSASNKSAVASMGNDGIFGRSRFFAEENEEDLIQRPASTGVIGRNEESETADVNSILETLGLASLGSTATNDQQQKSNSVPSSPYSSTVIGAHAIASPGKKKSIMEKIHESPKSTTTQGSNYFTTKEESNNVFTGVNHGATQQYPTEQNQPNILHQGGQQQQQHIQYVQQPPATHYNPQQQQQVYYHPAPPQAYYDNRGQQYTVPQQQTVYINQPAATPYGYDYHGAPQQHLQHHNGHVIMPHQGAPMHAGQTQYVSVVPIQGGPHIIGGPPGQQYAYVQYGDGMSPHHAHHAQPTLVAGAPTFVMGPNGPMIPVANSPMAINYSGHGSSPPGGTGQSPQRNSLRSPDRRKKMGGMQGMSTPRGGKRIEKSSPTPSKPLSPEASNLLDEIRASKSRNQWSIHDIKGYLMEFCLDQNGSRFIQQRLEVADPREKEAVMDEIIPQIKDLNNDVFGNYVVQKLYEFGTDSMKKGLKGTLEGNMMLLSMQMYGCRVVQKAFESLDHEDLCDLLHEFDSYVLTAIQDQNGNHVMQKCIEIMSIQAREVEARSGTGVSNLMADKIQFIIDDVHANIRSLCCHPYGCRVLQRMLEHCVLSQKNATLDQIQLVHKALLDDQYGNYVIQHVLQYGRESDRDSLLAIIIEGNLLKLSRQKFASNVVEKLLKYGNSNQRNAIVREMLRVVYEGGPGQDGMGSTVVLLMVRDAYANYVVQTSIDVVPEGKEKRLLLQELKANEVQLRNYTFAKHIVAKIGSK